MRLDHRRDAFGDPVLEVEHILDRAVELLRPEMRTGDAVDQLRRDPQPVAGAPHAAFEHVADAEVLRDLAHVDGAALVDEGGIAGDHREGLEAAERRDDVLDHAIGEIVLLGVAAQVLERQHRERGNDRLVSGLPAFVERLAASASPTKR